MSGRRRQPISPTLFPFLAVLVCTLGTLILFLALVAQDSTEKVQRQIEQAAEAEPRVAESAAARPDVDGLTAQTVDSLIAEEQFRVSQLVSFRDAQAADVEQRRDHLTHLEDHLRRIRDELQRLSDEVKQATGEAEPDEIDAEDVAALKQRLRAEEQALVELKAQQQGQTPRIVIVPHKGPNGTDRRPIYLECTAQGLVIWPEGTTISMQGLRDAQPGANPLDEALRAARHHVLQHYGDTTPPYPLLVVRPEGHTSYHLARMAMGDWDDQFGVELVPDEVALAIPNADPNLRKRMEVAIRDAIARQRRVAPGERIALGEKRTGTPRPLSAKALDVQGRANGFSSARGVPTSGWDLSNASPYTAAHAPSASSSSASSSRVSRRGAAGWDRPADSVDSSAAISARELNRWEAEMRSRAAELSRTPPTNGASGGGGESMWLDNAAVPGESGGDRDRPTSAASDLVLGDPATGNPVTGNPVMGSPATGNPAAGDAIHPDVIHPDAIEADPGRHAASGTGDAMRESGQLEPDGKAADPLGMPGATTAGATTAGTAAAGQASASGSSSSAAPQASAGVSGSSEPPAAGQLGGSAAPPNPNLVQPNRRDWALPDHVAQSHGNSIVRTIRVVCDDSRFVLLGSAMSGPTES
ncbi:MAG: hypothetical protein ACF788_09460, partial [Novipirellula sp. JB048]